MAFYSDEENKNTALPSADSDELTASAETEAAGEMAEAADSAEPAGNGQSGQPLYYHNLSDTTLAQHDTSWTEETNAATGTPYYQSYSYDQAQQDKEQPSPAAPEQPSPAAPTGKRPLWKKALYVAAGLVVALGCGYIGAALAADSISDRVSAEVESKVLEQMSDYMEEAGGAVLYRSVDTTTPQVSAAADVNAVTQLAADSVVEISTEVVSNYNFFGMSGQSVQEAAGSGVILSDNGYILTCHHVIADASAITITLRNGEQYEATLMGSDEELDVAVLKIEATGLTPAVLGNSSDLVVGSSVVVIGNPLGQLGGTVTVGYISALDRELTIGESTYNLLQTDAAINGGNSGGGMFNANGELVGLVNAKAQDIGVEGLGFAIPIDDIKQDIEDLINYGYITSKVTLGVTLIDIADQRTALSYRVDELGVYILNVAANSNADYAGLRSGDRIISVDGEDISESARVVEIIGAKSAGDTMDMVISRNGEQLTLHITLYGVTPEKGELATQTSLSAL